MVGDAESKNRRLDAKKRARLEAGAQISRFFKDLAVGDAESKKRALAGRRVAAVARSDIGVQLTGVYNGLVCPPRMGVARRLKINAIRIAEGSDCAEGRFREQGGRR